MSSLGTALAGGGLLVAGFTLQNVAIVYWTAAAISPYGILLYANLFFTGFFGLLLLGFAAATRDASALRVADARAQRALCACACACRGGGGGAAGAGRATLAQLAVLVGLLNIANGFLIVYASPPDRTPPLVQAVLQNSGVLFAVPASKLALGDRKTYCARAPLAAALLVAASIAGSVAPTAAAGAAGEFAGAGGLARAAWIAVYLAGIVPGAAYNVVQQLFLIRSGALAPGVSRMAIARASLRALFYCNLAQLLWLLALWWVAVLPGFGASASVAEFADNTSFSLRCSLGLIATSASAAASQSCSAGQFGVLPSVWAAAFAGGYCVSYIGSVLLNRESAAFNMVCAVVTTCLTSLYFLLPGTNPNAANTPLWSVLVALVCSLSGMVLWKRWESSTPAEEQFAVTAADDEDDAKANAFALSLTAPGEDDDRGAGAGPDGRALLQDWR